MVYTTSGKFGGKPPFLAAKLRSFQSEVKAHRPSDLLCPSHWMAEMPKMHATPHLHQTNIYGKFSSFRDLMKTNLPLLCRLLLMHYTTGLGRFHLLHVLLNQIITEVAPAPLMSSEHRNDLCGTGSQHSWEGLQVTRNTCPKVQTPRAALSCSRLSWHRIFAHDYKIASLPHTVSYKTSHRPT